MSASEVVDGTAAEVPEEDAPGMAVAVPGAPSAGTNIIRAEAPSEVIAKATEIANALKSLIDAKKLSTNVGGKKDHLNVEGWQALGALLGALGGEALHAETIWTRPVLDGDGRPRVTRYTATVQKWKWVNRQKQLESTTTYEVEGHDWEACVEIRTASGTLVGRAEGMCSREESKWARRDEFALRSMAETRAESRAYRRAAGWIVTIAGYAPTPAEEMPPQQAEAPPVPEWALPGNGDELTAAIGRALTCAGVPAEQLQAAGSHVWGTATAAGGGSIPQIVWPVMDAMARAIVQARQATEQAAAPAEAPAEPVAS